MKAKTQPSAADAWVTQAKETQNSQVQSIKPTNTAGIEDGQLVPSEHFSSLPSLFFKPVNFLMVTACVHVYLI